MDALLEAADAGEQIDAEIKPSTPLQEKPSLTKPASAAATIEEGGSGDGDEDDADGKDNGDGSDSDDDGKVALIFLHRIERLRISLLFFCIKKIISRHCNPVLVLSRVSFFCCAARQHTCGVEKYLKNARPPLVCAAADCTTCSAEIDN